jgi:hypothetical protein
MIPAFWKNKWVRATIVWGAVAILAGAAWALPGMFEIGSGRAMVLSIMGHPDSRGQPIGQDEEEVWIYGLSTVAFRNGYVVGWDNRARNLRVFMGLPKKNAPLVDQGSSKEAVIAALGTPQAISPAETKGVEIWTYGITQITMIDGQVTEWTNNIPEYEPGEKPVHKPPTPPKKFFQLGSSPAQVTKVAGKPGAKSVFTNLKEEVWTWGESSVIFRNGAVAGWSNMNNRLSVFMSFACDTAEGLHIGSSRQEVVDVLGTPREIVLFEALGMELWVFPMFSVTFREGCVFSWNNLAPRFVKKRIYYCPEPVEKLADDSIAANSHPLKISPTRMPRVVKGKSTPIIRDDQGCAWPYVAEDGSYYRETSALTGQPKTVYVAGFYRGDGKYVKSHFRSE